MPDATEGPTRHVVLAVLGPAIAVAVLLLVFAEIPLHSVSRTLRGAHAAWVGAALGVSLLVQLVDAARLRRWTDLQRLGLSVWDLLRINVATQFYGLVLPGGSLSGIAVRCSQLSPNERKLGAGVSLVADQAAVTVAMGSVGLVFWLGAHPERGLLAAAAITAVGGAVMLVGIPVLGPARIPAIRPIRRLMNRLGGRVRTLSDGLWPMSQRDLCTFSQIGALAVASNLLRVMVYYLLARALGLGIPLLTIGWMRSVMVVATMPPITVSGLGLREGASLLLLNGYGIAAERIVAFSLSVFAVAALFGLVGGMFEIGRFGQSLRVAVGKWRERRTAWRPRPAAMSSPGSV